MMANTVIPVFSGGINDDKTIARQYYSLCDGSDKEPVYYDINYPLELALKEMECNELQVGFRECMNCRAYGMQNNIAIMPCSNCIDTLDVHAKYKCHIADATMNPCGTSCTWFAPSHGIYNGLTPSDFCLQKLHIKELNKYSTVDTSAVEAATILGSIRSMLTESVFRNIEQNYVPNHSHESSSDSEDEREEGEPIDVCEDENRTPN